MPGLVRDKFAKTKKVETDDVKLLTAHFAGGGFISKEMIGAIVFSKLTAPCHSALLLAVGGAFPAVSTAYSHNKKLLEVEKDGRRAAGAAAAGAAAGAAAAAAAAGAGGGAG